MNPKSLPRAVLLAAVCATLLAACAKEEAKPEVIRPVRTLKVAAQVAESSAEFSGDVRPRFESRLGFRVGGKIVKRLVDVGAQVSKGQVLAQLDPQDLKLAESAARANVASAQSQYELAKSDLERYRDLRSKNFISQAELDRRQTTHDAALAALNAARAQANIQDNQADYAVLHATDAGIITAIEAEAGQVVTSGQTVVRLAQTAEKEIAISVPEDKVNAVRNAARVGVSLWAVPGAELPGRVREIAPAADPTTRTYAVRISVPDAPAQMRWGMTATVRFVAESPAPLMRLPLASLVRSGEQAAVWVVEPNSMTVQRAPVSVAGPAGTDVLVAGGITPGQLVVTAGAHLLQPGQKVKLLPGESVQAAGNAPAPNVAPNVAPSAAPKPAPGSANPNAAPAAGGAIPNAAPGAAQKTARNDT